MFIVTRFLVTSFFLGTVPTVALYWSGPPVEYERPKNLCLYQLTLVETESGKYFGTPGPWRTNTQVNDTRTYTHRSIKFVELIASFVVQVTLLVTPQKLTKLLTTGFFLTCI